MRPETLLRRLIGGGGTRPHPRPHAGHNPAYGAPRRRPVARGGGLSSMLRRLGL